jgi:hypothetical protein
MILKEKDTREFDIKELERLLALPLTAKQRSNVEKELNCLRLGEKGEKDSCYNIDFHYRHATNWIVIHDLRLEHMGQSAQIDHLLINRVLEFNVLETKNFSHGVKITENGEFMKWTGKQYEGIPSPIEQNKRHIELLEKVIKARDIIPKRTILSLSPSFKGYVLVDPEARVDRPATKKFDTSSVVKADAFVSHIEKEFDEIGIGITAFGKLVNLVSNEEVVGIGKKLVKLHKKPGKMAYAAKFGINEKEVVKGGQTCQTCGVAVTDKAVSYCKANKELFGGNILCFNCQRPFKDQK